MSVSSGASASGLRIYQGSPSGTTAVSTGYTTPANSTNVPSPYSTFSMTEIDIVNYSGGAVTAYVYAGGTNNANLIAVATFTATDTKFLSGTRTQIPANTPIYVQTNVASSCTFNLSGAEIQ